MHIYLFNNKLNTFLLQAWKICGKIHSSILDGPWGNVLFNDELSTFYLWLYGIRHVVKDHSDKEKGNPLLLIHWMYGKGPL